MSCWGSIDVVCGSGGVASWAGFGWGGCFFSSLISFVRSVMCLFIWSIFCNEVSNALRNSEDSTFIVCNSAVVFCCHRVVSVGGFPVGWVLVDVLPKLSFEESVYGRFMLVSGVFVAVCFSP